ncbi:MAG: hypothetical protein ABSA17_09155, partial [Rhabdochlamydiaceae bacterium]
IPSFVFQALLSFYQSYAYGKEVYQSGRVWQHKSLTTVAKSLMGAIRLSLAKQKYDELKMVEDYFQFLQEHPLKNLPQKIEANRVVLQEPAGPKNDFGTFFHGFGKGLVKGANLRFQRKIQEDGTFVTELSFKINEVYRKRFEKIYSAMNHLSDQERQEVASLTGAAEVEMPGITQYFLGDQVLGTGSSNNILFKDIGWFMIGRSGAHELEDHIQISLNGDQDIDSFQRILTVLGLDEALKPSTPDDFERMKLGFLFKFFFPLKSDDLQTKDAYFELPVDQLKEEMIRLAPSMENYINECKIDKTEVLPGYFRYTLPIADKVHKLGARALTASMSANTTEITDADGTIVDELIDNDLELDKLTNILKHGLFSQEMRDMARFRGRGINDSGYYGAGGSRCVYTQIILQTDLDKNKKVEEMAYHEDVRFYFSLNALNRGSYQFPKAGWGSKANKMYRHRTNITEFIDKTMPDFARTSTKGGSHEVMVPDTILPEEIMGISIKPELKEPILDRIRQAGLVKTDSAGREVINGIPLDEFISTEPTLSSKNVKYCS